MRGRSEREKNDAKLLSVGHEYLLVFARSLVDFASLRPYGGKSLGLEKFGISTWSLARTITSLNPICRHGTSHYPKHILLRNGVATSESMLMDPGEIVIYRGRDVVARSMTSFIR